MLHRGELLKTAIIRSGISITRVAEAIGRSRRWLYLQFDKSDVPIDTLLRIGKFIRHDFSPEIPELSFKQGRFQQINDAGQPYPENDPEYWKDKYLRLLEEYTALLKKT
jgi:predicted transcriptional regulator